MNVASSLRPALPALAAVLIACQAAASPRLAGRLVGHYPTGPQPTSAHLVNGGKELVVGCRGDSSVLFFDTETMKVTRVWPIETVGYGVWDVVQEPKTLDLVIANWMGEDLRVLDQATGKLTASLHTGIKPSYVALSPDGTRAYAAGYFSGDVSILDLERHSPLRLIDVGQKPMGVAVSPDGRWLYVAACSSRKIDKVDLKYEVVLKSWAAALAETTNLVVTPDGRHVVAAADKDRIVVMNTDNGDTKYIRVGEEPAAVALTPDGTTALVAHYKGSSIGLVDLGSGTMYGELATGPGTIAVMTDGQRVYACNDQAGSVSVYTLTPAEAVVLPAAAVLGIGLGN